MFAFPLEFMIIGAVMVTSQLTVLRSVARSRGHVPPECQIARLRNGGIAVTALTVGTAVVVMRTPLDAIVWAGVAVLCTSPPVIALRIRQWQRCQIEQPRQQTDPPPEVETTWREVVDSMLT